VAMIAVIHAIKSSYSETIAPPNPPLEGGTFSSSFEIMDPSSLNLERGINSNYSVRK